MSISASVIAQRTTSHVFALFKAMGMIYRELLCATNTRFFQSVFYFRRIISSQRYAQSLSLENVVNALMLKSVALKDQPYPKLSAKSIRKVKYVPT